MKTGKIEEYDPYFGCCLFEGTEDCHCEPTIILYNRPTYKPLTKKEIEKLRAWLANPDTRISTLLKQGDGN
jgi:hypothetical protein